MRNRKRNPVDQGDVRIMERERVKYGIDDNGEYIVSNVSMVKGGEGIPRRVYTYPFRHLVTTTTPSPRGWYKGRDEPDRVRPRPCYSEALLTTPYGGWCPINCAHCYINAGTRGYRSTGLPVAHPKYPETIRYQVKKLMVTGPGYITSFSEPFHPLENEYGITQDLTQVFLDEGLPIFYLSRQLPPPWAIDALRQNPYSYMQWSVNTSNPDHYRRLSPGSFELEDLYKYIYQITGSDDIFISIQVNPIVAGITTLDELVELIYNLADCGAHHVIFKFIEQVCNNRRYIVDRMSKRGLPRVAEFDRLFSQVIGGVYTIQQDVRIEWLQVLLEETRKVGMSMSLCYEYYDNGKAGASLAPWFTTADQCHGRGVPIYYRPQAGAPFQPLPGCYRKGCLYCETYGTSACEHVRLLSASALDYKDLRETWLVPQGCTWDVDDSCLPPDEVSNELEWYTNPNMMTDAEMWDWPTLEELTRYE